MAEEKKPAIEPKPDGPYIVTDLERLISTRGPLEARPKMALCRCGSSSKKPFCDGTHKKIGFSSAKLDGRTEDKRESIEGDGITIHDNRGICAHIGRCTDGLPSVFRSGVEPWIDPSGASRDEIMATIKQCPSGALSFSIDDKEGDIRGGDPVIFIAPHGPYFVTGDPDLLDTELGEGASTDHFALCRCGGSKNKPFCDGTHWYIKFRDDDNA